MQREKEYSEETNSVSIINRIIQITSLRIQ